MKPPTAISQVAFQAALNLARTEGKRLGQVIEPFLAYASAKITPDSYIIHMVEPGDSLGSVARKFYGDARHYRLIQQANNIPGPGHIWVGLVLVVPPLTATPVASLSQPLQPPPVPAARQPDLSARLARAKSITGQWQQAETLGQLLPALAGAQLRDVLALSRQMTNPWAQAKLLAALAPRLAQLGDLAEALAVTRLIKRDWSKAQAITQIAPHLPAPLQPEALAMAGTIAKPEDRSAALVGLAPHLTGPRQLQSLRAALSAIKEIEAEPLQLEAHTELESCLAKMGVSFEQLVEAEPPPSAPVTADTHRSSVQQVDSRPEPAKTKPKQPAEPGQFWLRNRAVNGRLRLGWAALLLLLVGCTGLFLLGTLIAGGVAVATQDRALERITLASDGRSTVTRTSLENGQFYTVVVSGMFNYDVRRAESWADAQSSYYRQQQGWVTNYWLSIDGQKVIAQVADAQQHRYIFYVQGNNRPIKLRIEERRETDYLDNAGQLEVVIYQGLLEWTDIQ